jgi:ubiquitin conjugation factor E4 B
MLSLTLAACQEPCVYVLRFLTSKQWKEFCEAVENAKSEIEDVEALLGDIPDEFLDPLMCSLMEDPVTLPGGFVMDRSVITRHLLNDERNPFNNAPLKLEELQSNPEMKNKIETWKAEQIAKRR